MTCPDHTAPVEWCPRCHPHASRLPAPNAHQQRLHDEQLHQPPPAPWVSERLSWPTLDATPTQDMKTPPVSLYARLRECRQLLNVVWEMLIECEALALKEDRDD